MTNKRGSTTRQINITGSVDGSVVINASALSAGSYIYALHNNDMPVASKQMVLPK